MGTGNKGNPGLPVFSSVWGAAGTKGTCQPWPDPEGTGCHAQVVRGLQETVGPSPTSPQIPASTVKLKHSGDEAMVGGCRKKGPYEEPQTDTCYFCQYGKILVLRMDSCQVAGMAVKPSTAAQGRKHRHAQAQAHGHLEKALYWITL